MASCSRILRTSILSPLILFSCCFLLSSSSQAAYNISQGQSITDGQTLISQNKMFALGFFYTTNSSKRYVGVWYNNISNQTTVVWVANRDTPLTDSSGNLNIGSTGNLDIKDGTGAVIWSTNASLPTSWNRSIAVLDDTGNLILRAFDALNKPEDVWESFAHPTDTFLPGMNVKVTEQFTSWRAADDPSTGNFTIGMDPSGTNQLVIWEGGIKRWRSGQWDGQVFIGITGMRPLNANGFNLINGTISFTNYDPSTPMRFVMRWDGEEEQLIWNASNQSWVARWAQPKSQCEFYGQCGAFGVCTDDGTSTSRCSCLRGFVQRNVNDWGSGCVRRRDLVECGSNASETDGFWRVGGVKLPDSSNWILVNRGADECAERCLGNCSCKAYAYVSGIGCLIWAVDLMDVITLDGVGKDLYLRLARSELDSLASHVGDSKKSKKIIIIIVVVGAVFLSICAYGLWRWRANVKGCFKRKKHEVIPMYDTRSRKELSAEFSGPHDLGEGEHGKVPELTYFNLSCIAYATENFSDANKLGEGGFGPVYKGKVPGGQEIAVKRLSKSSGQGLEEFKNEVVLIAKLQHRNLVRLLGCCIQGDERMLVYEYMPNKSLDFFLFDPAKRPLVEWTKRFNIIEGIARGLLYLHRDSRLRIIHRDLKASNILLDEEMSPKISDFGMARIFGGNQNHANTNRVVGTYGYMAPEYAMEGLFSVKSDVYSFGVLVLEIISGRKNGTAFHHDDDTVKLVGHAWKLWNEDKGAELIDPSLGNSYSMREVLRCIHVGLLCVQDHAADRPNMSSVVLLLEGETRNHQNPKPPTYSVGHSNEIEPFQTSERYSTNDATMSIVAGR